MITENVMPAEDNDPCVAVWLKDYAARAAMFPEMK